MSPLNTTAQPFEFVDIYEDNISQSSASPSPSPSSIKQTPKRRRMADNINRTAMIKNALDFLSSTKEEDEFEIYGKYVAITLRNYTDAGAVRRAKAKLNQILASLEAGEMDSTKIISISPRYSIIAKTASQYSPVENQFVDNVENLTSDTEHEHIAVDFENPEAEYNNEILPNFKI